MSACLLYRWLFVRSVQPGNVMVNILFTYVMKYYSTGIFHLTDLIKISM